ncbi:MAG: FadR family transcriptional regulator [Rhodospirillaceae bacterium]|nr:FadR family transcriptional regulator [Rhodospirillaceae bacterium]
MDLVPVERRTAAQSVAEQILAMIRRGALKPGDQLPPERELMEKLSVGRSSIREAMQILATLNVVSSHPGSGTYVRKPSPDEILRPEVVGLLISNAMAMELLEARQMIEPFCVRLACLRATDEDLARIEDLLDRHQEALNAGRSVNEHAARFHVLLAAAAHNRVAVSFMESIIGLLMARGRRTDRIPGYAQREIEEHREVLRLVRLRDADRAESAIRAHVLGSAATYDTMEGAPDLLGAATEGA